MKFAMPVAILAAISGTCAAKPAKLAKLDDTLRPALEEATTSVGVLDTAVQTFDGDMQPSLKACDVIIAQIQKVQEIADGIPSINVPTAASCLPSVQRLAKLLKTLLGLLKSRVSDIQKAGQCQVSRNKLDIITTGAKRLIATIVGKFDSPIARDLAQRFINEIYNYLDQIRDSLAEPNCRDAN